MAQVNKLPLTTKEGDKMNHITVGKMIDWLKRRPETMDMPLKISFKNKTLAVMSLNDGGDGMYLNVEIE